MTRERRISLAWLAAFAGIFAALAACVFWGAWSMDIAPVMPDDPYNRPSAYGDVVAGYLNEFLGRGKILPTDLWWSGLLVSPYFCQELKYAVSVFLAGLALAYFLRGRGLDRLASYGAGLLLAFSGYWLTLFSAGHGGWFVWMSYGIFAFGLADRAVRCGRLRHWLLLGLTVAWAGFNQPDLWLLFTVFTAAYFGWCCWRERKLPWKGSLIALAVFLLAGAVNFRDIAVNVVKDRQAQIARGENVTQAAGAATEADKKWEFATNWSLPPSDLPEFVWPRIHGDTSCPLALSLNPGLRPYTGELGRPLNAAKGNYRQHSLYVGLLTVLFAFAGVAFASVRRRGGTAGADAAAKSDVWFFAAAAAVCCALSLGRYCEFAYRIVFALPAGDLIRCPVKWHHLTEFSLAVLAGYGIHGLGATRIFRGAKVRAVLAAVVLAGAVNLAVEARRFCAPVDMAAARRTNSIMQLTILPREQFRHPQVAAMVKAGRIVSLARYFADPNCYVVGVLHPWTLPKREPDPLAVALGALSLLTAAGVCWLALRKDREV